LSYFCIVFFYAFFRHCPIKALHLFVNLHNILLVIYMLCFFSAHVINKWNAAKLQNFLPLSDIWKEVNNYFKSTGQIIPDRRIPTLDRIQAVDNPTATRRTWVPKVFPPIEICLKILCSLIIKSGVLVPLKICGRLWSTRPISLQQLDVIL
jgi:hypothetical protein